MSRASENKSRQAWLNAWDQNTLQQGESQTGAFYEALAIDDFRQMTEGEKATLPPHVRQEYEETISNMDFAEQERLEQLELANAN